MSGRSLVLTLALLCGCSERGEMVSPAMSKGLPLEAGAGDADVFPSSRPESWDFGGDMPEDGPGGSWKEWAGREWPAACDRLDVRRVVGRVEVADRRCAITDVIGIEPGYRAISRGALVTDQGQRIAVIWEWGGLVAGHRGDLCPLDPIGGARRAYRLSRSRTAQMWRLSLGPDHGRLYPATVHEGGVEEVCRRVDAWLAEHGVRRSPDARVR